MPRQPRIINVGGRWTDGRHLCRLKAEQSPIVGSGVGGADRYGRKARAGEGGGLGGSGAVRLVLRSRSVQQPDMLARQLARRAERRQSDEGRSFQPGAGATVQAGSCRVHHRAGAAALRRPNGGRATSAGGPMLQPPSPQRAPVNKRTTMPSRTCGPMILAS